MHSTTAQDLALSPSLHLEAYTLEAQAQRNSPANDRKVGAAGSL